MKNAKKIGLALLLTAVLVIGVVIAVFANTTNYTGTIEKLESLVQNATEADTITLKEDALTEVENYIKSKPVDPASDGYDDVIEAYKAAKIDMVELYTDAIADTSGQISITVMKNYSANRDKWFNLVFVTDEDKNDESYAGMLEAVHTSNMYVAGKLYDAVNQTAMTSQKTTTATAEADGAYKTLKTFFAKRIFNTNADDYKDMAGKVADLTVMYEQAVAARYYDLTSQARMSDYAAAANPVTKYDFEGSTSLPTMSNNKGYNPLDGSALDNTSGKEVQILPDGSQNHYFAVNINGAMNQGLTGYISTYYTINFNGTVDQFVMEFDFTSFTELPNSGVLFQSRPSAGTATWMEIESNGDIVDKNGKVLVKGAVVPGEWTHFTLVCEVENIKQSTLYLDYAYAATINGDPSSYGYKPEQMRVGNLGNSRGQYCIDNINISFTGSIVDRNFLNRMNDTEKFVYLCDYMQRTGDDEKFITVPDCVQAYESAAALAGSFGVPNADGSINYGSAINDEKDEIKKQELIDAVDAFYAYDPTEIILTYEKMNLSKYKSLIDALKAIEKLPTSSSISKRNAQVGVIENFISSNGKYIFVDGDDFAPITAGSGTAADPFILTHGNHEIAYGAAEAEAGWVYFKYVSKDPGTVKFTVTSEGAVVGHGSTVDAVTDISDSSITKDISAAGDEYVFAVKSANGEALGDPILISVSYDLGCNYNDLALEFSNEVLRISQDVAISEFISTMEGFANATSATLLQSRYNNAVNLISEGLNVLLASEPGYEEFKNHLEVTYAEAPAKIAGAISDSNAKVIINSINYIVGEYPNESDWKLVYIENPVTPEEIANNEQYKYIESYVDMIRKKISGGAYNPDYVADDGTSVTMAAQKFEELNDYYYGILQETHIEVISAQFEKFVATDSYIEKRGIISYIQRYLNSEDVDYNVELTCLNERCASCGELYKGKVKDVARPACPVCETVVDSYRLVSDRDSLYTILKKYTAYEAELDPQEGDYEDLLNQNTVFFVNAVKKFDTAITYVEKLALLNEAMPYYYAMNISDDEVQDSIAKYDALAAELAEVQKDSADFIENVLVLPTVYEDDEYYKVLVAAATLRDRVDESIDGVSEAIESYEAALAEYNAHIGTANAEIANSGYTLGSLGANSGIAAVLSVILKVLFSF